MTRSRRADRGSRAFATGHSAERVAGWWLRLKGYRIRATRYKTPVGEIDLIAEKGGSLVFVEVKSRPARETAAEAISPRQRRRIEKAARWYMAREVHAETPAQFDVVLVVPRRIPLHIKNAWQSDE